MVNKLLNPNHSGFMPGDSYIHQLISINHFFRSTLNDWFSLDINIRNSESISLFKSRLLSFIRPVQNNIYNIFDPEGLKFLT